MYFNRYLVYVLAYITYQYLCSEISLADTASVITIFPEP